MVVSLAVLLLVAAAMPQPTARGIHHRGLQQSMSPGPPPGKGGKADAGTTVCEGRSGNAATFNFVIGEYPAKVIEDGTFPATAADNAADFFVQEPDVLLRALRARYIDIDDDPLFHNNLLYLDTGEDRILFDTGNGIQGGMAAAELKANGVDPESITKIMLTHGHFDHIGGLFRDANATDPTFPGAEIYISRTEWEYWRADEVDTGSIQLPKEQTDMLEAFAKLVFSKIEDQVVLFDVGAEVLPGIECIHTPWHTPGHCAYLVSSGNHSVLVTGDAILNIVAGLVNPWIQPRIDILNDEGPAGRYQLLDRAVSNGWLVKVMHGTYPGLGYVTEDAGTRFDFHERRWKVTPGAVAMCPGQRVA